MGKAALLIGVSNYGTGFDSIPEAQTDVQAVQQVLQHPDIGDFTDVKALLNPDRQIMEEAIETLFSSQQQKDTLVLLYFCGHGIKDENGNLYLATSITRTNQQAKLVKSSAVPISFIQEVMNDSCCKQQVMILDCHLSHFLKTSLATEADMKADSATYLPDLDWSSKEGQAILMASTSTQHDLEQSESGRSVYTHYLVEGMENGVADLDSDGIISVVELHQYAGKWARTVAPAMQPKIYGAKDVNPISLAKAPVDDPKRKYYREVERCTTHGKISVVSRSVLDLLRDTLGLHPNEAAAIEARVLEPYLKYQKKLQRYAQGFVKVIRHESPIREATRNKLREFQRTLGLTNADIAPIETQAQQKEPLRSLDQAPELARTQRTATLLNQTRIPVKQLNGVGAPNRAITSTPSGAAISSWNRSAYPTDPVLASESFQRLTGIGILISLTLMGLVYGLPLLKSILPLNPLAEEPSATIPTPLSTSIPKTVPIPLPESLSPSVPLPSPSSTPTSQPASVSKPRPASVSESSSAPKLKPSAVKSKPISELKPSVAQPKAKSTSVSKLKPSAVKSKPRSTSSRFNSSSLRSKKALAVPKRRPKLSVPDAPPTSRSEAPPSSAPKTTLPSPDAPPTSWSEAPPSSAPPDSNF